MRHKPRITALREAGRPIPTVDVGSGEYLMEALFRAGPCTSGMNGPVPLTWLEVWAYGQATGGVAEPWEHEMLIDMSRAYLEGLSLGKDVLAIPPIEAAQRQS